MYICKICDSPFNKFKSKRSFTYHIKNHHKLSSEEYYNKYEGINPRKCLYCDNNQKWDERNFKYLLTCGNRSCNAKLANKKSKESFYKKYGVKNPSQLKSTKEKVKDTKKKRYGDERYNNNEKRKQTNLKKYGKEEATQNKKIRNKIKNSLSIIDKNEQQRKIRETNIKRYGSEHTFQCEMFKKKREETSLEKYGATHPFKNKSIYQNKFVNSIKEKYGVDNVSQLPEFKEKIKITNFKKRKERLEKKFGDIIVDYPDYNSVKIKCPDCNKESLLNIGFLEQRYKFGLELCTYCFPYNFYSNLQKEISEYIKSLNFEILENYKIPYSNKEIDIFIPEKNIGFEINGLYWHSEIYKDKFYHQEKKKLGLKNNINIINIWEDDILLKKEIIKNRIQSILGINKAIGARKCTIKSISTDEAKSFFQKNHLYGYINSTYKIGLFYNDKLVSAITFGTRNKKYKKGIYEILRYATINNLSISGGFNKMIKYFIKNYHPLEIFTYIDLDWANGRNNIYENNNFKYMKETQPDYSWVVYKKRENRQKFMKHKLVNEGYDKNKTEDQIMHDRGFYKIWGCGNLKYDLNLENKKGNS